MAGLGQTTKQDDCLRSGECHKVSKFLTQHLAREVKDLLGNLVACLGCLIYIVGGDVIQLAERGLLGGVLDNLLGRTCHACSRSIGFDTSALPAPALAPFRSVNDLGVTELTGKAVVTVHNLSVNHDTRANACTQRNLDKVLHTACCTVGHLTHGSGVGIVGNAARYAHAVLNKLGKRHNAFPR